MYSNAKPNGCGCAEALYAHHYNKENMHDNGFFFKFGIPTVVNKKPEQCSTHGQKCLYACG